MAALTTSAAAAYTVGVIGATGAVGAEMLGCLHKRGFPVKGLPRVFASERSAGRVLTTPFGNLTVECYSVELAQTCDFIFMAVSGSFAKVQ